MGGSFPESQEPFGLEQPLEDVLEQRQEVPPPPDPADVEPPLEADPADVMEQGAVVPKALLPRQIRPTSSCPWRLIRPMSWNSSGVRLR
jgi:hypothetical protein